MGGRKAAEGGIAIGAESGANLEEPQGRLLVGVGERHDGGHRVALGRRGRRAGTHRTRAAQHSESSRRIVSGWIGWRRGDATESVEESGVAAREG